MCRAGVVLTARPDVVASDTAVIRRSWARFGSGDPLEIRRLPGRSHRVYECVADRGPALIARLGDERNVRFAVESALIRHCADAGIPVPVLRHVGVEETTDGTAALMVQEKAAGEPLSRHAQRMGPEQGAEAVANVGETLAAIHDVRTTGFGPLDSELQGATTRLSEWFIDGLAGKLADARRIEPDAGPVLDQAAELLSAHRDLLDGCEAGLVHGDFSPDNVLVDEHGHVTAVIDWEAVKSGPPEMDIGWWDCFFDTPSTPVDRLVEGHQRHAPFDPARLAALRHLTVLRIMVSHFSWSLSAGDPGGLRQARERLTRELA